MAKLFSALWPCQSTYLFLGRCELCDISVVALFPILVGALQDRVLLNRRRLQTLIPLDLIICFCFTLFFTYSKFIRSYDVISHLF